MFTPDLKVWCFIYVDNCDAKTQERCTGLNECSFCSIIKIIKKLIVKGGCVLCHF